MYVVVVYVLNDVTGVVMIAEGVHVSVEEKRKMAKTWVNECQVSKYPGFTENWGR